MVILRKRVAGLSESGLARFATRASQAVRLKGKVQILITGNREMQSLNRQFRSLDKPTDVLSFPAEMPLGGLAGDIAISAEIASQNAKALKHSAAAEIKILTLHGILHLAGYDHETDDGRMARKEASLRKLLGLPTALIERNNSLSGGRGTNLKGRQHKRSAVKKQKR